MKFHNDFFFFTVYAIAFKIGAKIVKPSESTALPTSLKPCNVRIQTYKQVLTWNFTKSTISYYYDRRKLIVIPEALAIESHFLSPMRVTNMVSRLSSSWSQGPLRCTAWRAEWVAISDHDSKLLSWIYRGKVVEKVQGRTFVLEWKGKVTRKSKVDQ